ncbi:hypothetical protein [Streptomyces violascens]|uniref:hypothetical protein n=1 Tax=Streptomyces violascens TaxID=67381 RepID=UPI001678A7B8|nr:hypothetical protein [Streptomyces violascens]GGU39316.1 hypothetical protein GCM10010289_70300 [Streptomyces violascens]
MSKYRPKSLPKGSTSGQPEGGSVPPVRTREEIRAEWEATNRKAAEAKAAEMQAVEVEAVQEDSSQDSANAAGAERSDADSEPGDAPEASSDALPMAAPNLYEEQGPGVEELLPGDDGDGLVHLPVNRDRNGYVEIQPFSRPESDDPKERFSHYARSIAQAEMAGRANEQRAKQQKIIVQGQNFVAIKEEKLWETMGFPHFDALMKARFGFGKNYANKVIRAVPVVMALEAVTSMELVEKHLRPLCPVYETFGEEAVRQVWSEASRKKITEKNLQEAAAFLGFAEPVDQKAKVVSQSPARSSSEVGDDRVSQAKEAIRSLRATDEAKAREAAIEFMKAAQELFVELGIDMVDASV